MKARIAALPPRAVIAIAAGAVLVYALALWFLLVAPKRAEATTLADDVIAAELQLAEARVRTTRPQSAGTQVSDVLRLAKAMPSGTDQPGLVSYDSYWDFLQGNAVLRSVPEIREVIDVSKVVENRIQQAAAA